MGSAERGFGPTQLREIAALIEAEQSDLYDVLAQYVAAGVQELDQAKLAALLTLRYSSLADTAAELGAVAAIRDASIGFQPQLYR